MYRMIRCTFVCILFQDVIMATTMGTPRSERGKSGQKTRKDLAFADKARHRNRIRVMQTHMEILSEYMIKGYSVNSAAHLMGIPVRRAQKVNGYIQRRMKQQTESNIEILTIQKRSQYAHILKQLWEEWELSKKDSNNRRIVAAIHVMDRIITILNEERKMLGIDKVQEINQGGSGVMINWDTLLLAHKMQQVQNSANVQLEAHTTVSSTNNPTLSSGSDSKGIPVEKSYSDEIDERIEKLERMAIKREEELDDDPLVQRTAKEIPQPTKRLILKPIRSSTT